MRNMLLVLMLLGAVWTGGVNAACVPTVNGVVSPIIAGVGQLQMGNGSNTLNGAAITGTGKGSIAGTGVTSNNTTGALPALNPPAFPTALLGTGTTTSAGPVIPGNYGTLNVTGNPTVFSGGTYYINTLNVNGGPITLGAGTYFINNMNLKGNGANAPNVTVTGAVQIYIGSNLNINNANNVSINGGGNAGNLQVNLYPNSQFDTNGNNISFTGLIYAPYASSQVQFVGNNNTITGAIVGAGQVQFNNNTTINFNATVQSQISGLNCGMGSGIDHFLIGYPSTGLTCSPQTVTVAACANAACTSFTGGVSVTLQPGGVTVTTSATGAVNSTVAQTTVGMATLNATSVTTTAGPTQCANTTTGAAASAANCANAMMFNTAGFVITVPNQISGMAAGVTIAAMQANTANRCIPAFAGVTRPVNLNITYANPATGTLTATISTGAATAPNAGAVGTTSTGYNLVFDATGTATIALTYPDVGSVTLNASGNAPNGVAMNGSGSFIAAPASFAFGGVTAAPIKAGNNFAATVTARNSAGATTPNFGREATPEGVMLSFNKCQPTGTSSGNGAFSGNVGTFAIGVANAINLNWSEVGNLDLLATLASGSYLGSGLTATGNTGAGGVICSAAGAGNVGNFIPDHFVTATTDGCAGCGFTYSGQTFTVSITAMNGLPTPTPTFNYDGTANTSPNFANNVTLIDADAAAMPVGKLGISAAAMGVIANAAGTMLTIPKTDFTKGVVTLASVPTYTFNASNTAPTVIKMRAVDSVNAAVTSSGFIEGMTGIRSGRIKVFNANGSELLPLPITATVQYYNGTSWVASTTDNVTQFNTNLAPTGNVGVAIVKAPLTGVNVLSPSLVIVSGGSNVFNLAKPGVEGVADISIINAPVYLTGNGIPGRATFGIYKGKNEFIFTREAY